MVFDFKKQISDTLLQYKQMRSTDRDNAEAQFRDKSALICPDTNVLQHMVARATKKNFSDIPTDTPIYDFKQLEYWLSLIDKWSSQMGACKELLGMHEVGWIVPQQIHRERIDGPTEFDELKEIGNSLKDTKEPAHFELQSIIYNMIQKFDRLMEEITKNREGIEKNLTILEEKPEHIMKAWQLIYGGDFPNHRKQQMKDSVILSHLHDFQVSTEKPLFFWTFDKFDGSDGLPFPYNIDIVRDISDVLPGIKKKIRDSKKSFKETAENLSRKIGN